MVTMGKSMQYLSPHPLLPTGISRAKVKNVHIQAHLRPMKLNPHESLWRNHDLSRPSKYEKRVVNLGGQTQMTHQGSF